MGEALCGKVPKKQAALEVEAEGPFRARSAALQFSALAQQVEPQRHEVVQVGLLLVTILVMTETGVIAFSGVLQEGVIEDSAAQEVWDAEGGSPVQVAQAVALLVLRSTDEAGVPDGEE